MSTLSDPDEPECMEEVNISNQDGSRVEDDYLKMIICHDYLKAREDPDRFRLCQKCPLPPSKNAAYKLCCDKH